MAEKKRSRVLDYLAYLAVRLFVCVLQAFSFDAACRLANHHISVDGRDPKSSEALFRYVRANAIPQ